jgi:hypothetical protein
MRLASSREWSQLSARRRSIDRIRYHAQTSDLLYPATAQESERPALVHGDQDRQRSLPGKFEVPLPQSLSRCFRLTYNPTTHDAGD